MPQNINYRRIRWLNSCKRPFFRLHSTSKPKLLAFGLGGKFPAEGKAAEHKYDYMMNVSHNRFK